MEKPERDIHAENQNSQLHALLKQEDRIIVNYYTDPLCCWSWALEPHWQRLRKEWDGLITTHYIMGGLIKDWKSYNDPFNDVSRPAQMGPLWMHASEVTSAKINYTVWNQDPPSTSYPACLAVKCAALQCIEAEEIFLHILRHGIMVRGYNISNEKVILSLAKETALRSPAIFDYSRFESDWKNQNGNDSFRKDLEKCAYHKIGRFPTLTFTSRDKGLIIVGYRPYDVLEWTLNQLTGDTAKVNNG